MMFRRSIYLLVLSLIIAGCSGKGGDSDQLNAIDADLAANSPSSQRDPALSAALGSQIMVDPQLSQQANDDAVRPPPQPRAAGVPLDPAEDATVTTADVGALKSTPKPTGDCPGCRKRIASLTLGALAETQGGGSKTCAEQLRYSAGWAQRLPRDLPLYPDARLTEAAGTTDGGCTLRAVSFATNARLQRVLDWYYTRSTAAGFAAQHQASNGEHMLGGTRGRDKGAFALFLKPRAGGGTDVDLVANNGS